MPYCAILECKNDSRANNLSNGGVSYHRFPHDPHIKEQWIDATGRQNWMPTKRSTICSNHFESKHLILKKGGQRYLSDKAVPTLNIVRFCVEKEVKVKDEPASDSDLNDDPIMRQPENKNFAIIEVKTDPDNSDNIICVCTDSGTSSNKHASSQNDTFEEQKLKRMVRGRDELIRKQKTKIKRLQANLRRLNKRCTVIEAELVQRKIEDDEMGVTRYK